MSTEGVIDEQIHSLLGRSGAPLPYTSDLNAVIDALGYDDLVIQFQPDQPLTFTIYVTSYRDDLRNPSFAASDCDDEWGNAEDGWQHPTLQQLAARSLLAYLQWKSQAKGEV